MRISFSTLGCPDWDLNTICKRGQEFGFDGVDFRGCAGELDITRLPEFTTYVNETQRLLANSGLETSGISSSIRVCLANELIPNLDEARRTIAVCHGLGAVNVRVFGSGDLSKASRAELARVGCETIENILELDGAADLHWLFETHDIWVKSTDCKLLLDSIPHPAFGVLWDIGHTPRVGGETPAATIAAIGARIGYTHIKDAVYDPNHLQAMEDGWRYVSPGQGQVPLTNAIELLQQHGYNGWLTFEHEKRWHPELPEPEQAFPDYSAWAKSIS